MAENEISAAETPPRPDRLDLEAFRNRIDTLRQFPDHEDIDETLTMASTLIAEIERLRAVGPPSMDLANHHNAAKCPYCNPELDRQFLKMRELNAAVEFWKARAVGRTC